MDPNKQQVLDRLNKANNVLISVSRNPSVDQLSAAIGLALVLNKLGKHAVAVFSGTIPSTIEFLQPEKTFEKTTDSLRDFIISLDKSKADKLRYKVENNLVRVFITPYRTSLNQDDLEFSQGDFNVDVVMALGVHEQTEIDQAITAHGRILHDATVIAINKDNPGSLGSINWSDPNASSLCEMLTGLCSSLKEGILDNQMATAFLTGIVAETDRFSNDKTKPSTMQASSALMTAGANQQLVATKLQEGSSVPAGNNGELPDVAKPNTSDGSLEIAHGETENADKTDNNQDQIHIDEHGQIGLPPQIDQPINDNSPATDEPIELSKQPARGLALQPPTFASKLTANAEPEHLDPSVDILGDGAINPTGPTLSRKKVIDDKSTPEPVSQDPPQITQPEPSEPKPLDTPPQPVVNDSPESQSVNPEPAEQPKPDLSPLAPETPQSLEDLEKRVDSPHLKKSDEPQNSPPLSADDHLTKAREAVEQASESSVAQPEPIQALNSQPIELNPPAPEQPEPSQDQNTDVQMVESDPGLPPGLNLHNGNQPQVSDPTAPPAVPPPMMPPADGNTENPQ